MPHLIIVRGLPGSGKSTFAKRLSAAGFLHFETDMWMTDENGKYRFDPSQLKRCHEACQNAVRKSLDRGVSVVVSNTFSRIWEMQPYLDMPYEKTVVECQGSFDNVHGVPTHTIRAMKERWETYPT